MGHAYLVAERREDASVAAVNSAAEGSLGTGASRRGRDWCPRPQVLASLKNFMPCSQKAFESVLLLRRVLKSKGGRTLAASSR